MCRIKDRQNLHGLPCNGAGAAAYQREGQHRVAMGFTQVGVDKKIQRRFLENKAMCRTEARHRYRDGRAFSRVSPCPNRVKGSGLTHGGEARLIKEQNKKKKLKKKLDIQVFLVYH